MNGIVIFSLQRKSRTIPNALQATVNRAYSKAQQALENSVEALQIARDEVPEKRNKPCNATFWEMGGADDQYGHFQLKCTLPKYPGHEKHKIA